MTGVQTSIVNTCLQETDLEDGRIFEMISTFLATGELPILFSNDEEDGLLQVNGSTFLSRSVVVTVGVYAMPVCTVMMSRYSNDVI